MPAEHAEEHRKASWITEYEPWREPVDFEERKLPAFRELEEGMIVFASGSPRCGRFLFNFGEERPVAQLSTRPMIRMLREAAIDDEGIIKKITTYREPRRQWQADRTGEVTDGGLSEHKARIAAAAALLLQASSGHQLPRESTFVGRDYNLANYHLDFLDKPGLTYIGGRVPAEVEERVTPDSWVRKGTGPEPTEPLGQLLMLHRPEAYYRDKYFYQGRVHYDARAAVAVGDLDTARRLLEKIGRGDTARAALDLEEKGVRHEEIYRQVFGPDLLAAEEAVVGRSDGLNLLELIDKCQDYKTEDPLPFYIANSGAALKFNFKEGHPQVRELIERLVDLSQPLPEELREWVSLDRCLSFMAVKPTDKEIVDRITPGPSVFDVFNYYTGPLTGFGHLLYAIPGIVDWSRPPFSEHLEVWVPQGRDSISYSCHELTEALKKENGSWQSFSQLSTTHPEVTDELVGFPTFTLRKLFE